ncbi:MAG: protein translocase subunit SecD, partial [Paracoccaceae bacterium]
MLFIDLWKKVVIWVVVALGLVLALPNAFYDRVEQFNDAEKAIEVGFDAPENREKTWIWPSFLPSGLVNLGLDLR